MGTVADNLRRLRERVESAARRTGQNPERIVIVAVTKNVPVPAIVEALDSGQADFGENRIQEAKRKIPEVAATARWHMIGHLQTNKVKDATALFDLIQSVDSPRLAEEIGRQAARIGKTQDVLVQVNTTGEPQKSGCAPEDVEVLAELITDLPAVRLRGLMTIGPLVEDEAQVRAAFRSLKLMFDRLADSDIGRGSMTYLSMGMSGDFEMAVEEGANMVRIGTAIFDPRS